MAGDSDAWLLWIVVAYPALVLISMFCLCPLAGAQDDGQIGRRAALGRWKRFGAIRRGRASGMTPEIFLDFRKLEIPWRFVVCVDSSHAADTR
jgi:hypothetical protein